MASSCPEKTQTTWQNPATLDHTIVAGNLAYAGLGDCQGMMTSVGFNLIGDTSGGGFVGDTTGNLLNVDPMFVAPAGSDYSLQVGSPCIDAGDGSLVFTGRDVADNPRVLDGNLDGLMVLDIGANEFNHVRLDVSGAATPGGTVTLASTGTAGLVLFLFAGIQTGEVLFPPYGTLFVDLASSSVFVPFGSLPNTLHLTVPTDFPSGLGVVLQELALDVSGRGNLSNAVEITVQ
jgi:hypothetical protein